MSALLETPSIGYRFTPTDHALIDRWAAAAAPFRCFAAVEADDDGAEIVMVSLGHPGADATTFVTRRNDTWLVETMTGGRAETFDALPEALSFVQPVAATRIGGGQ